MYYFMVNSRLKTNLSLIFLAIFVWCMSFSYAFASNDFLQKKDEEPVGNLCSAGSGCHKIKSHPAGKKLASPVSNWSDLPAISITNDGRARVIVELIVKGIEDLTRESAMFRVHGVEPNRVDAVRRAISLADLALAQAINAAGHEMLSNLRDKSYQINRQFTSVPFVALSVSEKVLEELIRSPAVQSIYPDVPVPLPDFEILEEKNTIMSQSDEGLHEDFSLPMMIDTIGLIGADLAWSRGYTGEGWHVAILDTGIRASHEFFQGKDIVEACFSLSEHCPNGQSSMTGQGAAAHFNSRYDGYDHGTHVAGTAAGKNEAYPLFGVAKDAGLIAVNVFSKFSGDVCGDSNDFCVMSWTSDQLAGLEYVYSLRGDYNIGAVNMSLGGGVYTRFCDSNPNTPAINNLAAAGIVTAISSGNDGYCGEVGAPSCISSAITVMASTKNDIETGFNNWHSELGDIFAPGQLILSATGASDSSYQYWNGTSMAAPHVAGAMTLMRQYRPLDSPEQHFARLVEKGPEITTLCPDQQSKPRLYVNNFDQIAGSLLITIEPAGARDAGAGWRRTGTSMWFDSGQSESGVAAGEHTVTFKGLSGWDAPDNIQVEVNEGAATSATGTYVRHTGSLTVFITPPEAVEAGMQWRRRGTQTWYNSGDTETGVPTGEYTVEFKAAGDFIRPATENVSVEKDTNVQLTWHYQERPKGALPGVMMLLLDDE